MSHKASTIQSLLLLGTLSGVLAAAVLFYVIKYPRTLLSISPYGTEQWRNDVGDQKTYLEHLNITTTRLSLTFHLADINDSELPISQLCFLDRQTPSHCIFSITNSKQKLNTSTGHNASDTFTSSSQYIEMPLTSSRNISVSLSPASAATLSQWGSNKGLLLITYSSGRKEIIPIFKEDI